jgi:hypothetical protein
VWPRTVADRKLLSVELERPLKLVDPEKCSERAKQSGRIEWLCGLSKVAAQQTRLSGTKQCGRPVVESREESHLQETFVGHSAWNEVRESRELRTFDVCRSVTENSGFGVARTMSLEATQQTPAGLTTYGPEERKVKSVSSLHK